MIALKNGHELERMRKACKITAAARALAGEMVKPGVTTKQIDKAVHDYIVSQGAKPSFLGYGGFPASTCISVNDVVIHGIPGGYTLKDGDIVSIDVGAYYQGFHGDCAATFACGNISPEAQRLIDTLPEDYVVIMVADHGGHDRTHGTDMPEDMDIPLIITGGPFEAGKQLRNASIKDVAPTVAALLGVDAAPEWEGKVLYNES